MEKHDKKHMTERIEKGKKEEKEHASECRSVSHERGVLIGGKCDRVVRVCRCIGVCAGSPHHHHHHQQQPEINERKRKSLFC